MRGLASLEADLVASARPGRPQIHERLAVYADLLLEREDPFGHAIVAVLRDNDLELLGLETFSCENDTEGTRTYDLLVVRYRPFARAVWLPQHVRSIDAEMVLLPAIDGMREFVMGAPREESRFHDESAHTVQITRPFLIGRTAVTQAIYDATGGTHGAYDWHESDQLPAHNCSWNEVSVWCQAMGVRLPSEAEWEYAARGGTATPFCFGKQVYPEQANCGGDAFRLIGSPGRVGRLPENAYGLHEVHGNVWEWCADDFGLYERTPTDGAPHRDRDAGDRVCRGGSCLDDIERCRSAARQAEDPELRSEIIGFRVARDLAVGPVRSRLRTLDA